jgi:hypothetical protein
MNEQQEQPVSIEECRAIIAKQKVVIDLLEGEIMSAKIFENNYITTRDTANLLDVKARTVRLYNHEGKITGKKRKKEGRLLFSLKEVLAYRKESLKDWRYFG